MDTETNEVLNGKAISEERTRRRRTGKKRLKFQPPKEFPRGVRELWAMASREEQERAHQACTLILAMWLGKKSREEVSAELELAPLRVWQLSQQALSGMLSGLLHQPRPRRVTKEMTMEEKDEDPRTLKVKNAELSKQVKDQQELIQLLMQIPKPRSEPSLSEPTTAAAKTRAGRARAKSASNSGSVSESSPDEAR
jgi:hypothetical protein